MFAAMLAADLVSKHVVFASLLDRPDLAERVERVRQRVHRPLDPRHVLRAASLHRDTPIPGVKLTLSTNPGVVFGLPMPRWLVAAATVATTGLVLLFFASSSPGAWGGHVALGLVLAGAVGNLYDRLFSCVKLPDVEPICYQVRDFIDASQLGYPYIFNVADILLVIGVALLIIHWALGGRKRQA